MLSKRMNSIMTTGVLAALLWLAPMAVRAADISDGGGFFSAEAIATANQSLRDLEQKSGHEIRIETFAAVPTDKIEVASKMDAKQRDTFFSKWVLERAKATKSRGIVVLICREPSHLNLWAGTPIQDAGFGVAQAKTVKDAWLTRLKAKEYDKALTEGVAQMSITFGSLSHPKAKSALSESPNHGSKPVGHASPTPASRAPIHSVPVHNAPVQMPQQSPWTGVMVILMFVVGGIVVMSLIGRLFGGGRNMGAGGSGPGGYGQGGGYGGGGGGFLSSLTGGIFGAMAGNWMYDQFSGRHASGGESHSMGDSSGTNDTSSGSGFDSGSSDTGFSGGTDFGGGDFGGGGDGGGGDSGGGSDVGGGDF